MIISLVTFSLLMTAGVVLIFRSSEIRDVRHATFVRLTGEVERDILQARILLDEIHYRGDPGSSDDLQYRLDSIKAHLTGLDLLIRTGYSGIVQRSKPDFSAPYALITGRLEHFERLLQDALPEQGSLQGNELLSAYNQFSLSYKVYEANLYELLFLENGRYRIEIIGIIFLNLLFLVLAGYLIIRLIDRLILADRSRVRQTIEVEKRERERIAADLHDGLGSLLSGLIIHIQVMEKEYEENPELSKKLKHLNQISNQAITGIEEAINNLNPSLLSRLGLVKSLERITARVNQLGKTRFSIDSRELDMQLQESTELLLFRICMELINNALRHSSASWAEFRIFNIKKEFHLLYRDDGVGFNRELLALEEKKGGLYNLMRRVESLEGSCRIYSEPDRGVEVEIIWAVP